VDILSVSFDPVRRCDGIRGTGGGVPANTGTLIGLPGDRAGAGIPVGVRAASAPPNEDLLADRFSADGVREMLAVKGWALGNCFDGGGGPRPRVRCAVRETDRFGMAEVDAEIV